jgi:hypothetical protein
MSDQEFRAVLDWFMCSDPWPVQPDGVSNHNAVLNWLNRESRARGWSGWVEAYHEAK